MQSKEWAKMPQKITIITCDAKKKKNAYLMERVGTCVDESCI